MSTIVAWFAVSLVVLAGAHVFIAAVLAVLGVAVRALSPAARVAAPGLPLLPHELDV